MNSFHKVANLLDQLAAAWEATPPAKAPVESKQAAETDPMQTFSETWQGVFGSAPPSEMQAKIAADPNLAETFFKLAERVNRPDSLGGPGDRDDAPPEPQTKAERMKAADARFGNWLANG
jgi:hypothetical protein